MTKRALLLTGGMSRRMGRDKALIEVDGQPMAVRIANELTAEGWLVTVLGRQPLEGFDFRADETPNSGPLDALRNAPDDAELAFVVSCDLPLFRGIIANALAGVLEGHDAVVPILDGRHQPLCAVYRGSAFSALHNRPHLVRVMDWVGTLRVRKIEENELEQVGISPLWLRGVNTAQELDELLAQADWPASS